MTDDTTPVRSSWTWLIPGAILAIGGAIWLWFLAQPRVCILIFPPPPGCNSAIPSWLPYVGIGLLALLLIVLIVLAVRRSGTRALVGTVVAMAVVVIVFVVIMYLAFAGVFDFPVALE